MSAFNEVARGLSGGRRHGNALQCDPRLKQTWPRRSKRCSRPRQHEFPVIDAFGKPVGLLVREDLLSALKDHDPEASITATFMRAPVETVATHGPPLEAVLDRLSPMGRKPRLWLLPIPRGSSSAPTPLLPEPCREMMIIKTMHGPTGVSIGG